MDLLICSIEDEICSTELAVLSAFTGHLLYGTHYLLYSRRNFFSRACEAFSIACNAFYGFSHLLYGRRYFFYDFAVLSLLPATSFIVPIILSRDFLDSPASSFSFSVFLTTPLLTGKAFRPLNLLNQRLKTVHLHLLQPAR